MADPGDKARIEIEVALNDMFTTALKSMYREVENTNKKVQEFGQGGGVSINRLSREVDNLDKTMRRSNTEVTKTSSAFENINKTLLGATGLVFGLYSVGRAMESIAQDSVRMQNFSRDTGFATQKILDMQQTLRRGGFTAEESGTIVSAVGKMSDDLATFGQGSETFQKLIRAEGGADLASKMLVFARAGETVKVTNEYLKVFLRSSDAGQSYMARIANTSVSALQRMAEGGRSNVKVWEVNEEQAKKYLGFWIDSETRFNNIFKAVSDHGIEAFNKLSEALKGAGISTRDIADGLKSGIDVVLAAIKQDVDDVKAIMAWLDTSKSSGYSVSNSINKAFGLPLYDPSKFPAGEDTMGKDYTCFS